MGELIFKLPPFKVQSVFTMFSEITDWGLIITGVPELWKSTKGKGVKVAVLDTGASPQHPDLIGAIKDMADFTDSRTGPLDGNGHSCHCCGIIGARANEFGIIGVAPECELYVAKVLDDSGVGSDDSIAKALAWALSKKVDIISMSLGCPVSTPTLCEAVTEVVKTTIMVCAAGNEGPNLDTINYPAKYPEPISVGAIDRDKKVTKYSSRGERVDIVAPGDNVLSDWPPNKLARLSGTSMATPFVAGVIALLMAMRREKGKRQLTRSELVKILGETATDLGPNPIDPGYGHGLINPISLLELSAAVESSQQKTPGVSVAVAEIREKLSDISNKAVEAVATAEQQQKALEEVSKDINQVAQKAEKIKPAS
jgi:subtilisin family serine protease